MPMANCSYVEGYEDGSYVDLLELREYTDARIQTVNKGSEFGTEPLQTGEKYLFTFGRTQKIFRRRSKCCYRQLRSRRRGRNKDFFRFSTQNHQLKHVIK